MFANLKVKTQLMLLSGVSLALFIMALLMAVLALQDIQSRFQYFVERDAVRLTAFSDMYAQGLQSGQALRNIMLDPENRKAYDNLELAIKDFKAAMERARTSSSERPEILAVLDKIDTMAQNQHSARSQVIALVTAGQHDEAKQGLNTAETPAWRALKKELLDTIALLHQETDQSQAQLAAESTRKQSLIIAVAILATLAMLAISATIARNLLRQLGGEPAQVSRLAGRIADGDLTHAMSAPPGDQGSLVAAFSRMQTGLHGMVSVTQRNAAELSRAAGELTTAARQATAATSKQSEAATGMAASVEETSVSIDQVRDSAEEARKMAFQAGEAARDGGQIMRDAADEMVQVATVVHTAATTIHELEGYSSEITAIINVIREVAEQTNLLALNAAIEAARAGEQGRGFAVVADEVRKLAERTTESTHTIATVIDKVQTGAKKAAQEMGSGVERVNGGVDLARRAGDSVSSIESATDRVAAAISEIGNALNEQAIAVQEIAGGVERIANMAEENSASVRQSTSATERLRTLAAELESSVARFKV